MASSDVAESAGSIQNRRVEKEAKEWGVPVVEDPQEGELPIISLAKLLADEPGALDQLANQLKDAFSRTGFFLISSHGCEEMMASIMSTARTFHTTLSLEDKESLAFGTGHSGVGYLRINQKVLPKREKGNMNETILFKRELGPRNITLDSNPFPPEHLLPGFRQQVLDYTSAIEKLAMKLLPAVALALDLPSSFFAPGFTRPTFRLRMNHYPPVPLEEGQFGIAPHTDSTFFTLLNQDGTGGLTVSTPDGRWIAVPARQDLLVFNTGELLKQWSNDRVPSTPHFAVNKTTSDRYSVPFFFNCDADYVMQCLPSCTSEENPPKYPPMTFLQSQAAVQGE